MNPTKAQTLLVNVRDEIDRLADETDCIASLLSECEPLAAAGYGGLYRLLARWSEDLGKLGKVVSRATAASE